MDVARQQVDAVRAMAMVVSAPSLWGRRHFSGGAPPSQEKCHCFSPKRLSPDLGMGGGWRFSKREGACFSAPLLVLLPTSANTR
jgi:hypothetical protein